MEGAGKCSGLTWHRDCKWQAAPDITCRCGCCGTRNAAQAATRTESGSRRSSRQRSRSDDDARGAHGHNVWDPDCVAAAQGRVGGSASHSSQQHGKVAAAQTAAVSSGSSSGTGSSSSSSGGQQRGRAQPHSTPAPAQLSLKQLLGDGWDTQLVVLDGANAAGVGVKHKVPAARQGG